MNHKSRVKHCFWVGFTLIELLVVIAIIGILMGLVAPSLSRAREISRKTVCKANLHSVALSFNEYLETESHGTFPEASIMPSVDSSKPGIATVLKTYLGDPRILKCPSDRPEDDSVSPSDYYFNVEGTSYEYPPFVHKRKADALIEDGQTILFDYAAFHSLAMSGLMSQFVSSDSFDKEGFKSSGIKGAINFLYADGSVAD
jgi:prepilin-type N-terminal cleavage/methylation domain-containing protein/prepilin-type processing-associated H-X9-DG protein